MRQVGTPTLFQIAKELARLQQENSTPHSDPSPPPQPPQPHRSLSFPLRQVGSLTLFEIAQELARLQRDASAGKLSVADLKGGTFTLSNIGNLGGTYTSPVINQPEIAIAGLGKTRATPRYDEMGNLVKASIMQVGRLSAQPSSPPLPAVSPPPLRRLLLVCVGACAEGGRGGWALGGVSLLPPVPSGAAMRDSPRRCREGVRRQLWLPPPHSHLMNSAAGERFQFTARRPCSHPLFTGELGGRPSGGRRRHDCTLLQHMDRLPRKARHHVAPPLRPTPPNVFLSRAAAAGV